VLGEQIQYVQLQTCYLFTENEVHCIKNVTNFSLSGFNSLEMQHLKTKIPVLNVKKKKILLRLTLIQLHN